MTKEELTKTLDSLDKDYKDRRELIIKDYCLSNNPYKIGDVFTDHIGSIRIENIYPAKSSGGYCCVFNGVILRKDGSAAKKIERRDAWQSNEKK